LKFDAPDQARPAQYGALSGEKGRVELCWSVSDGNNGRLLKVLWIEHNDPRVRAEPDLAVN